MNNSTERKNQRKLAEVRKYMAALATVTRARPLKNTPRRPSRSSNTPASGRVISVAMVEILTSAN